MLLFLWLLLFPWFFMDCVKKYYKVTHELISNNVISFWFVWYVLIAIVLYFL